jgi:subtilisin
VPRPSASGPRRYTFLALLLLALLAPAGMALAGETAARYVVVFDDDAVSVSRVQGAAALTGLLTPNPVAQRSADEERRVVDAETVLQRVRQLEARTGMRSVADVYTSALGGFSADLTPHQVSALSADPSVSLIMRDEPVGLEPRIAGEAAGAVRTTANPSTRVPPGVRRVGARSSRVMGMRGRGQRVNADVAVIDTGIDRRHPDLNVVGGYNCTGRNRNAWDDSNGHGTHVAGIVGALDNSIGVTGVAPGARLWSVVCGVDWVTAQRDRGGRASIEVANMSLTFTLPGGNDAACGRKRDSLHQAICRSVDRGTLYVAAAGNEGRNARHYRPAAYDEVITVSAMADFDGRGGGRGNNNACPYWTPERDDAFAAFSNYGADVDLIAPGRCILSTYRNRRYAWMSGTSMATPHVAGAAALYRALFPRATPQQTRRALQAMAKLDWRTGTDGDRRHEKAVWIGEFRAR